MNRNTKWVVAALALSLAVNIFMVGLSFGKNIISTKNQHVETHRGGGLNARALGRYLSEDERRTMRDILNNERRQIRQNLTRLRHNEEAIRNVLSAPVVDQKKLNSLIDEHEMLVTDSRSSVQRKIFAYIANLSPETRAAIAVDLFKPRRGNVGKRRGDRFGQPPRRGDELGPPPHMPPERNNDQKQPTQ